MTSWDLTPNPLTPAMEEVIKMRSKRVSVEIDVPITPEPSGKESGLGAFGQLLPSHLMF
jgi:hypothetical protein